MTQQEFKELTECGETMYLERNLARNAIPVRFWAMVMKRG